MSSHTPGPWNAGNAHNGRVYSAWGVFASGKRIATVTGGPDIANATLMASAPELLAALEYALDTLTRYGAAHTVAYELAAAAIAKATGEDGAK